MRERDGAREEAVGGGEGHNHYRFLRMLTILGYGVKRAIRSSALLKGERREGEIRLSVNRGEKGRSVLGAPDY